MCQLFDASDWTRDIARWRLNQRPAIEMRYTHALFAIAVASALIVGCSTSHSSSLLPSKRGDSVREKSHHLLVPGPATTITTSPNGIYMGIFDNESGVQSNTSPHPDISAMEVALGRKFAINLHYVPWDAVPHIVPSPNAACPTSGTDYGTCIDVQSEATNGRIPLISWNCGDQDQRVAQAGPTSPPGPILNDYNYIIAAADAFHEYGHPLMVRWFWEMNLQTSDQNPTGSCVGTDDTHYSSTLFYPPDYVNAWKSIHNVIVNEYNRKGWTNNITWVWNPGGLDSGNMAAYFPGTAYVDWLGVDLYDRQTVGFAANLDNIGAPNPANFPTSPPIYTTLQGLSSTLPIIIGENGSFPTPTALPNPVGQNQVCYFDGGDAPPCIFVSSTPVPNGNIGLDAILKAHPQIHAFDYFDAATSSDNWIIDNSGVPTGRSAYKVFVTGAYESLSPTTGATATPAPVAISTMGPITLFAGSAEPTLPNLPSLGDYLLAIGTTAGGGLTAPSGWSKIAGAGQAGVILFDGTVGGSGGISPATTYNFGGTNTMMQLFDVTGGTGLPIHSSLATAAANGVFTTAPGVTTTQSGDLNLYILALRFSPQATGWSIANSSGVSASSLSQLVDKDTSSGFLSLYSYLLTSSGPLNNFTVTSTMTASPSPQSTAGGVVISVQQHP